MGLRRNPVVLAGVLGVGVPVVAAGVVAALAIDPGETGLDAARDTTSATVPVTTPVTTSASATPSIPAPAPHAEPAGFQPDSVTFASAEEGWALGRSYPCAGTSCLELRRTTDGGHTWQTAPLPAPLRDTGVPGVLRFSDTRNGWLHSGNTLWSTHDGGTSWLDTQLDLNADGGPWTLSATADTVRIAAVAANGTVVVYASPVDSESWSRNTVSVVTGSGPDPAATLIAAGSREWLVVTDHDKSGARLVGESWTPWQLPCGGNGPADWHAVSERRLIALCGQRGPYGDDAPTTRLLGSTDGGASFSEVGQVWPSVPSAARLLAADSTHLAVGLDDRVLASADGGETWTTVYTAPDPKYIVSDGEFVTDTNGFVLLSQNEDEHGKTLMLTTRDAGRTWAPVDFTS